MKKYKDDRRNKVCLKYVNGEMTQAELAYEEGISISTISKWLAPYRKDDPKFFVRRAQRIRKERENG